MRKIKGTILAAEPIASRHCASAQQKGRFFLIIRLGHMWSLICQMVARGHIL